jgi:hypothetical protein
MSSVDIWRTAERGTPRIARLMRTSGDMAFSACACTGSCAATEDS